MNLIRKEAEKCDRLGGFLMIMSMAGGTGSEAYPNSFLLNHVIWPYGTGENDAVHKICLQLMKIKQVSFQDVNRAIAHQLGSVFQPAYSSGVLTTAGDLMEALVPHPEFKMLGLRISLKCPRIPGLHHLCLAWAPETSPQMLIANAKMEEGIDWQVRPPTSRAPAAEKPSSNRGKEVQCADLTSFQDPALYTSWLNPPETLRIWNTPRAFNKYEKSASLVSNSQFLLSPLNSLVGKAWKMFASKAYIHQYSKFGIEEDDFLGCFTTLEQVIASYSSL
uniref:Tubulin delta chain n=1 Tax=Naja naja TaxID=35670 RepID=A0A8C6X7U6_NAJNA